MIFSEKIHAEDMLQRPGALVEKQSRRPCEKLVDSAFYRPIVETFVPKNIKHMEAENQDEKQPDVKHRLIFLVGVKFFYFLSCDLHLNPTNGIRPSIVLNLQLT